MLWCIWRFVPENPSKTGDCRGPVFSNLQWCRYRINNQLFIDTIVLDSQNQGKGQDPEMQLAGLPGSKRKRR